MNRATVLDTARKFVTGDREADHGAPDVTFKTIADFWSTYLRTPIAPHQVAVMMALLKIARARGNPRNEENWIDGVGYLSIASELTGDGRDGSSPVEADGG